MNTKKQATKACSVCGGTLFVHPREAAHARVVACRSKTVDTDAGLPLTCLLMQPTLADDTRHALALIGDKSTSHSKGTAARDEIRHKILLRYLKEVREGEPTLVWYRAILKEYPSVLVANELSKLPFYRLNPDRRFTAIAELARIDHRIERLRNSTNDHYAELVAGYLDSRYDLMHFGFANGLFGKKNPVKINTLYKYIGIISRYLEWVHAQGHASLQDAGRIVFDEYVAAVDSVPAHAYALNQFYKWVKKKYPFITNINFHRRGKGMRLTRFETLSLDESRAAFQRICQHPDPRGRALALLCLFYAQQVSDSITLRRDELIRDPDTDRWRIFRQGAEEAYLVEPELSEAIDACLTGDWPGGARRTVDNTNDYVFVGKHHNPVAAITGMRLIREASGTHASVLRRTGIVNMYRGGQKTMGTVVLRDILNVSSPTLKKAIRATGESVNTPIAQEEAEELRRAFLDDDEDA